ncbi:hypothetical protein Bpfe_029085, partial [Biomphalaria pfeifferi]
MLSVLLATSGIKVIQDQGIISSSSRSSHVIGFIRGTTPTRDYPAEYDTMAGDYGPPSFSGPVPG